MTHDKIALIYMVFVAMLPACATLAPTGASTAESARPVAGGSEGASAAGSLRSAAVQQLELGNPEMASSQLERSLRIEPDSIEGYFQLARVRVAQGLVPEARHLVSKVLSLIDSQRLVQRDVLPGLDRLLQRITQLEQQ